MTIPNNRMTEFSAQELLNSFRDWLGLPASMMLLPDKELAPLDKVLLMRLRTAYMSHLAEYSDTDRLPCSDLKDQITDAYLGLDGLHIPLRPRCIRPLRVRLACWSRHVCHIQTTDSPAWKRQLYSYLGATPTEPQVFLAGNELIVCGFPEPEAGTLPDVAMLECVAAPDDDTFRLDPAHLPLIFTAA